MDSYVHWRDEIRLVAGVLWTVADRRVQKRSDASTAISRRSIVKTTRPPAGAATEPIDALIPRRFRSPAQASRLCRRDGLSGVLERVRRRGIRGRVRG
jgi:hypothetical protein